MFHPLTTVREKIKSQQGCILTLYLLDSVSPEKEDNIPSEPPVNMVLYIYGYRMKKYPKREILNVFDWFSWGHNIAGSNIVKMPNTEHRVIMLAQDLMTL